MKTVKDLLANCKKTVDEILPWDLQTLMGTDFPPRLLDIREPYEFDALHIRGSMNVPRGILELACDYGYDHTRPELVTARHKDIVVICRFGQRSLFAAHTMRMMGYQSVKSLKTGVKGWNDYELPLQNIQEQLVDTDEADSLLAPKVSYEQKRP